jgi:2-oxo-3-hexenedioate decarboxylase
MNVEAIAAQFVATRDAAALRALPTTVHPAFDIADGYAVADAARRLRIARGERPLGYKIGFTNRGIWPKYNVHAPIWAPVWDSTLALLDGSDARLSLAGLMQPRLEPEIVFGFARSPRAGMTEPELIACLDWVAHGFEVVQTHFDGWRFQAPDTVADFGLHGRLLVGPRVPVGAFDDLSAELAAVQLQLFCGESKIDEGTGRAVLDGPLNALRLWVDAMASQAQQWPIEAGDVVTTGTLTDAWPLVGGQRWRTLLSDARLAGLTLHVEA